MTFFSVDCRNDKAKSERIQKRVFALGFAWSDGSQDVKHHKNCEVLAISRKGVICCSHRIENKEFSEDGLFRELAFFGWK